MEELKMSFKACDTCFYKEYSIRQYPCCDCFRIDPKPNWTPKKEESKKKAENYLCQSCKHKELSEDVSPCYECFKQYWRKNYELASNAKETSSGKHYDEGKVRVDLLPVSALLGAAECFTYGDKKYGEKNWEKGIKNSKLYGSCLRHLFAHMVGCTVDSESSLPHLNHALCNLMMLVDNMKNRPEMDDRGFKDV